MEQVSGISSSFLALERPDMPMAISSVAIYKGPSEKAHSNDSYPAIRQAFLNGIVHFPIFRRRLLNVPALLDHPYWIEDPDFDVDCHLRRLALPEPGNWHQFNLQLARLQSTPMHRDRPLWQAFIIEGLNGLSGIPKGSFAIVMRVHRAVADANALNDMMMRMHTLEPVSKVVNANTDVCVRENSPLVGQLLMDALRNNSRRVWQSGSLMRRGYQRYRRQRTQAVDMPELPPVSATRFNRLPSSYRVVSHYSLARRDCESLRRQVPGSSLCDVLLTVIGGALRLYLMRKGELPEQGLVAGCPQRLPRELQSREVAEQPGLLRLALHTDCASPLQRLRAMQQETLAARARDPAGDFALMNQTSELVPPLLLNLGASSYLRMASRTRQIYNTFVNGVRGSDVPLYFAGAEMLKGYSLSPLLPGCSLVHSVSRWGDDITIGINACREALPDPDVYIACLNDAWEELQNSVAPRPKPEVKLSEISPATSEAQRQATAV